MNWVKLNRQTLGQTNYVLKADISSNYWFGVSRKKIEEYAFTYGSDFNIILFGSEIDETDFYSIPFKVIRDLLTTNNLYNFKGRERWVGDIRNHILRIRNSNVERNISQYFSLPSSSLTIAAADDDNTNDYAIENAKREVSVRIGQSIFRSKVLDNFRNTCCLTGLTESALLVASHIIPWTTKIETRLSPHNGLCLSVLYDRLFDKGYFTLTDDFEVMVSDQTQRLSFPTRQWLSEIIGKKIAIPHKYEISRKSLQYHREHIFEKFE